MNIQGIGGSLYGSFGGASSVTSTSKQDGSSELDQLIAYFKETPAQRMEDDWLRAHHLTKEQFAAMPPAQQEAIRKQMASDIKNELKQKMESQSGTGADVVL